MKRWTVVCASVAFFLFFFLAAADITFSDIARWGLMRRADVFPSSGASLVYPTNGVLRVIESVRGVDSNKVVVTVLTNVMRGGTVALSTGVYSSVHAAPRKTWTRYGMTNSWGFDIGRPLVDFAVGCISNNAGWSWNPTNIHAVTVDDWPFVERAAESLGVGATVAFFTTGTEAGTFRIRLALGLSYPWVGEAVNVPSNATEVVIQPMTEGTHFGTVVMTVSTNVNVFFWGNDERLLVTPENGGDASPPWALTNAFGAAASAVFGEGWVAETNDFVSVLRLQDAVEDLELLISEAVEAHVQLLHP